MGRKKRTVALLMTAAWMLTLCACGNTLSGSSDNSSNQETMTVDAPKYMQLVGETEKEVVKDLGEGEPQGNGGNTADNGAVRQYMDRIYGAQANCAVLFNNGTATMVYVTYAPEAMDFSTLLQQVSADYGAPTTQSQGEGSSAEGDSQTAQWEMQTGSIFIYETADGCGIQIAG